MKIEASLSIYIDRFTVWPSLLYVVNTFFFYLLFHQLVFIYPRSLALDIHSCNLSHPQYSRSQLVRYNQHALWPHDSTKHCPRKTLGSDVYLAWRDYGVIYASNWHCVSFNIIKIEKCWQIIHVSPTCANFYNNSYYSWFACRSW